MSEPTSPAAVPAAWYPDPAGGPRQRWWDGTQWTDHFSDAYTTQAAVLKAPEGIPVYNVWIWLVVFLPLLSLVTLFTIDWTSFVIVDINDPYASQSMQWAALTSPAYILGSLSSWVIVGLIVLFAFFDWRTLNRLGVPRPFHWAWAFLGLVYPIGRSVVVRRRTGHGIAPMWVSIAITCVSFVIAIGFVVVIFVTLISSIQEQLPRY